jgi:hypothetical protein
LEAVRVLRPNQNFDEMERVASIGNSFYQGLILEISRRYRRLGWGFSSSFRAVYTLSKLEDDGLNNTTNAEVNGDFASEWARATQDRRHRFALSGVIETPWWLGKLRFSPLFRYGSSAPFNVGIGVDRNLNDVSTDRVIFNGFNIDWRRPDAGAAPTTLISQFVLQPIGARGGNIRRNAGRGPSMHIFDLNITREFRFGDHYRLRPNMEIGNVTNSTVFSYGSEFIDFLPGLGPNPTAAQRLAYENFLREYLVPTRAYRPRDIRFGLRFDF